MRLQRGVVGVFSLKPRAWLHRENLSQPAANPQGPTGNNARKAKRRAQIRPIRVFLRRKTAEASVSP